MDGWMDGWTGVTVGSVHGNGDDARTRPRGNRDSTAHAGVDPTATGQGHRSLLQLNHELYHVQCRVLVLLRFAPGLLLG